MTRWGWMGVIVVAVLLATSGLTLWWPWAKPAVAPPSATLEPPSDATFTPPDIDPAQVLDPSKLVVFVCVNESGGPCRVTIAGGSAGSRGTLSADLAAGPLRSTMAVAGPYTVEALTVERAGQARRQELNLAIPAGERREVRVRPTGTVELRPAAP